MIKKASIGELDNDDISGAIERFLSDKRGIEPAVIFLGKLTAVNGLMALSVEPAKRTRQNMFRLRSRLLFTISNYRRFYEFQEQYNVS